MHQFPTLLIRAPLLSKSGYGTHARSIAAPIIERTDVEIFTEITRWGMTADYLPGDVGHGAIYALRAIPGAELVKAKIKLDVTLQVCLPNEFNPELGHFNICSTAAVESDRIPEEWAEKLNLADLIHVPSEFTKRIMVQAGVPAEKISVVALNANVEHLTDKSFTEQLDHLLEPYKAAIIVAGAWPMGIPLFEDRKGLDLTIKNFMLAFRGEKETVLLVKSYALNPDDPRDIDVCQNRLQYIASEVGIPVRDLPPVKLVHGHLSRKQLSSLFRHEKVLSFATATHGEGFGLLIFEAWLHGLNVVATDWSGHLDFMRGNDKKRRPLNGAFLVKTELVELPKSFKAKPWGHAEGRWAEPDQECFIKQLQASVEEKGDQASRRTQRTLLSNANRAEGERQLLDQLPLDQLNDNRRAEIISELLDEMYATEIVVLSDLRPEQGRGAERTLDELLTAAFPGLGVAWLHPDEVFRPDRGVIADGSLIICANMSMAKPEVWQWLLQTKQRYVMVEFDYRWAWKRNPAFAAQDPQFNGQYPEEHNKFWSNVYKTALSVIFMSQGQKDLFEQQLGSIENSKVIGSYVADASHGKIRPKRRGYAFWNSEDPLKGANQARKWIGAQENALPIPFNGLPARQLKRIFGGSESLIFLPTGYDTDPRLLIEALACGCPTIVNDKVQTDFGLLGCSVEPLPGGLRKVAPPEDFATITAQMEQRKKGFRAVLAGCFNPDPQVSFYTTTENCIEHGYPFEQSIQSMLDFGAEVVVADLGSTDGTLERLQRMQPRNGKMIIKQLIRSKERENWGIDMHKADARSLCKGDILVQFDVDELLSAEAHEGWQRMLRNFPLSPIVLAMPMIEFWGSRSQIRKDYHPFKPRISRASSEFTHKAPAGTTWVREDGMVFIKNGAADGCEYVNIRDHQRAAIVGPSMIPMIDQWASIDKGGLLRALAKTNWGVDHLSWLDIERKLKQVRSSWDAIHRSRYGLPSLHNPHFPGRSWSDITGQEIASRAAMLSACGSRVFHEEQLDERLTMPVQV